MGVNSNPTASQQNPNFFLFVAGVVILVKILNGPHHGIFRVSGETAS
jgi:hypothetical protein